MTGETDLKALLKSVRPELQPGIFVFVTVPLDRSLPDGVAPEMVFREKEGWTCIVDAEAGWKAGLNGIFRCRKITLDVHSSLEAVGFIAAIATRLAEAGISTNPVSGFYHDHLFVPEDRADEAMAVLSRPAAENTS